MCLPTESCSPYLHSTSEQKATHFLPLSPSEASIRRRGGGADARSTAADEAGR